MIVSGHDTNLSNLSGMLGLSWRLPGYQADDTPPGGALVFSIWQGPGAANYFVRAQYLAQTLEQMRGATPLSLSAPPAEEDLSIPELRIRNFGFRLLLGHICEGNRASYRPPVRLDATTSQLS